MRAFTRIGKKEAGARNKNWQMAEVNTIRKTENYKMKRILRYFYYLMLVLALLKVNILQRTKRQKELWKGFLLVFVLLSPIFLHLCSKILTIFVCKLQKVSVCAFSSRCHFWKRIFLLFAHSILVPFIIVAQVGSMNVFLIAFSRSTEYKRTKIMCVYVRDHRTESQQPMTWCVCHFLVKAGYLRQNALMRTSARQ